jgi:hypothetical protein
MLRRGIATVRNSRVDLRLWTVFVSFASLWLELDPHLSFSLLPLFMVFFGHFLLSHTGLWIDDSDGDGDVFLRM